MEKIIRILRGKTENDSYMRYHYESLKKIILDECPDIGDVDKTIFELEQQGIIYSSNGFYRVVRPTTKRGVLDVTHRGTLFIMDGDKKRRVDSANLKGALPNDEVLYDVSNDEVKVLKVLKRNCPNIVCEVIQKDNGKYKLEPKKVRGMLNINISQDVLSKIGSGSYVLVKLDKEMKYGMYDGEVVKPIVLNGKIDRDLALVAFSNGFDTEFSPASINEVNALPNEVTEEEIEERKENDFRDELIFTIDGADTKDMDDAVSLKMLPNGNYELGVHIANVSHYLKKCPHLLAEAKERSTSLYMLNTVIPMLPPKLSDWLCSLNPNEDRLAKSVIMEIDSDGNVVNSRICDSVINSKKKMTYDDVNRILEDHITPHGYGRFKKVLLKMDKLSKIIGDKKFDNGEVTFFSTETNVEIDKDGKAAGVSKRTSLSAEKLIERFMILANETVASYVDMMDLPFVYRVHEGPNPIKLKEALKIINTLGYSIPESKIMKSPRLIKDILDKAKDSDKFPLLSSLLLVSMSRARYSKDNIGHFALASHAYTHFTSPIRRFPDTMVHFLLDYYNDVALGNKSISYDTLKKLESELEEACDYASIRERQADRAEFQASRRKIMDYMKSLEGEHFEAVINMIDRKEVSVTTDNGISGTIPLRDVLGDTFFFHENNYMLIGRHTKKKYKIGNRVIVTVKGVNEFEEKVNFTLDGNLSRAYAESKEGYGKPKVRKKSSK